MTAAALAASSVPVAGTDAERDVVLLGAVDDQEAPVIRRAASAGSVGPVQWLVSAADGPGADLVVRTADLVAVIDGDTDAPGMPFRCGEGVIDGARFAALVTAKFLETVDRRLPPRQLIDGLSATLAASVRDVVGDLPSHRAPHVNVAVLNMARGEVFSVGSCSWSAGERQHHGVRAVDVAAAQFRAAMLDACGVDPCRDGFDPGLDAAAPLLRARHQLMNAAGPFGFGAVDGTPVPDEFLTAHNLDAACDVVLCTDGYAQLPATYSAAAAAWNCPTAGPAGVPRIDDQAWLRYRYNPAR